MLHGDEDKAQRVSSGLDDTWTAVRFPPEYTPWSPPKHPERFLGPTKPILTVPGPFIPRKKRPRREADQWTPSSAEKRREECVSVINKCAGVDTPPGNVDHMILMKANNFYSPSSRNYEDLKSKQRWYSQETKFKIRNLQTLSIVFYSVILSGGKSFELRWPKCKHILVIPSLNSYERTYFFPLHTAREYKQQVESIALVNTNCHKYTFSFFLRIFSSLIQ
jgi:hypothetical protein